MNAPLKLQADVILAQGAIKESHRRLAGGERGEPTPAAAARYHLERALSHLRQALEAYDPPEPKENP